MPHSTLKAEQTLLEHIQSAGQIGICLRDSEHNMLLQIFIDDPALREALVEYQSQRVRELTLSTRSTEGMVTYPTVG